MSDLPVQVEAVYENGVLRPLGPLNLQEHERVIVRVSEATPSGLAIEYVDGIRREVEAEGPGPGLQEVQSRMAKIPGSMADLIIAERGDR